MSLSSTRGSQSATKEKSQLPQSFLRLCEIEGIKNEETAVQQALQKKSVEIFMQHGYSKIESLQYFSNITELVIIQQDIKRIENLSCLKHLESLWINENPHLTKIEGLGTLKQLKRLFLFESFLYILLLFFFLYIS